MQRRSHAKRISALCQSLQEYSVVNIPNVQIKFLEQRAIVPAEGLQDANVENFRRLHSCVYQMLGSSAKENFAFDHSANLLLNLPYDLTGTMFAVCTKYCTHPAPQFLNAGKYLCCNCTEKNKDEAALKLWNKAKETYHVNPQYSILNVQFLGLFQWRYEVQISCDGL